MNIYAKRLKDLQKLLKTRKLDGIVLARPLETGFLTGYHLEGPVLFVTPDGAWAFMAKMLLAQFSAKVNFMKASSPDSLVEAVVAKSRELGLKKVAFEPETETYLRGSFWKSKGFLEQRGLTAGLRAVKEGAELEALRSSCRIAAKAFGLLKPRIKTGRTELSVSRELEDLMKDQGATGNSFKLIVAFGPNAALPHHESSERRLKNDEAVLIDFGCVHANYCSDITRTFFHGRADAEFKKVYSIVAAAHKAGLAAVRDGASARAVDAACRNHISDAGYGQYFIHSTGHGVGLEIHEAPWLNTRSEETLRAGMTVTVEPGVYLPGKFGVRIEDSVLVKKNGCEILTGAA